MCNRIGKYRAAFKSLGLALALTFVVSNQLQAAVTPDKAYFSGKTVTYVVATKPGGGYDAYGRLVAKYMEKHLPGSTFIVKNVPGAGHIIGANEIYHAKANGLTIGTFSTSLVYPQLIDARGVNFDLARMSWIGKATSSEEMLVAAKDSKLRTSSDLTDTDTPWKLVSDARGSTYTKISLLSNALDWNVRVLTGYSGSQRQLAMRRGEADGTIGSKSSLDDFVDNGYGRYVFQINGQSDGVPLLEDSLEHVNADARQAVSLISNEVQLARLTAGPPGIPAARLAALRQAYKDALQDPALVAQAKKLGRSIAPGYGDAVSRKIQSMLDQSPATISLLKKVLAQ